MNDMTKCMGRAEYEPGCLTPCPMRERCKRYTLPETGKLFTQPIEIWYNDGKWRCEYYEDNSI